MVWVTTLRIARSLMINMIDNSMLGPDFCHITSTHWKHLDFYVNSTKGFKRSRGNIQLTCSWSAIIEQENRKSLWNCYCTAKIYSRHCFLFPIPHYYSTILSLRWCDKNFLPFRNLFPGNFRNRKLCHLWFHSIDQMPLPFAREPRRCSLVGRPSFEGLSLVQLYWGGFKSRETHLHLSLTLITPRHKVVGKNP